MSKIKGFHSAADGRTFLPGFEIRSLNDLLLHPIFFMTKPTFYDPNPELRVEQMGTHDNNMTANSSYEAFDPDLAAMQHAHLRTAIRDLKGSIILDEGAPGQFDGVYSADPSITTMHLKIQKGQIKGVHFNTIASNFYNICRTGEVSRQLDSISFFKRYLATTFGLSVTSSIHMPKLHGEGTGDNVYDPFRDIFWCGYKPKSETFAPTEGRSDPDFHKVIETKMNMPGKTVPFEVHNGFFHSDTIVGPTELGDLIVYPDGMSVEAFQQTQARVADDKRDLIVVDREDALNYAPNLICMNRRDIITAKTSHRFRAALEDARYRNTQIDLSQFVAQSGGGAHCLEKLIILRRDEKAKALQQLDLSL